MDTKDIILLTLVFVSVGYSIYKKYIKKDQDKTHPEHNKGTQSSTSTSEKDDDYEPYSGR